MTAQTVVVKDFTNSPQSARSSIFASLPTGLKLLLILSAALLPLALIAVVATLNTTQLVDAEAQARLRVIAHEDARSLSIELLGDMAALRVAADALRADPENAPICGRAIGVFAQQSVPPTQFMIVDRSGKLLCGTRLADASLRDATHSRMTARILPGKGVMLATGGSRSQVSVHALFPTTLLAKLVQSPLLVDSVENSLVDGESSLILSRIAGLQYFDRIETQRTELGVRGLLLQTSMRSVPITSSMIVSLLLPILMWGAAVVITWFVVDRLLLRPLRQLRSDIAAYQPGDEIDIGRLRAVPSQELRDLGDTFRMINQVVATHEAGLARGMERQMKLTREVHHRVKNNLQIISSLINFHSRGASSRDAILAYLSIQRRVDALAVVHRNHFAELEEHRGLDLRAMIGELASNLRATDAGKARSVGISLKLHPFSVSQDVAVAIAFVITEIVELAMNCERAAQISIALDRTDDPGKAQLVIVSDGLKNSDAMHDLLASRYGRILEGLARQLRSPLRHDGETGSYDILLPVFATN